MHPCSLECWLSSRTLHISPSSIEQNPWRRGWKFFCQEPTSQLQFWPWLKQLLEHYKEELAHRKLHLVGIPSRGFLHHPTKYAEKHVHYLPWFCSTQEFQSQQHRDCLHHLLAGSLGRLVIWLPFTLLQEQCWAHLGWVQRTWMLEKAFLSRLQSILRFLGMKVLWILLFCSSYRKLLRLQRHVAYC